MSMQEIYGLSKVCGHLDLLFLRQRHHLLHLSGMNQLLEFFIIDTYTRLMEGEQSGDSMEWWQVMVVQLCSIDLIVGQSKGYLTGGQ